MSEQVIFNQDSSNMHFSLGLALWNWGTELKSSWALLSFRYMWGHTGSMFRALTAWGKKLLSSLAERALMLRYHLPDGRSWKRLWEGWVGSFTMLLVLLEHRARKMSRMDGRGAPMMFAAVFTVRWRVLRSAALQFPYQTVIHLVSTLSMVPL